MILLALLACGPEALAPYPNPHEGPPQPRREHPLEVVARGDRAWVSLQGNADEPGERVAVVDLASGRVRRVRTGSSPTALAFDPSGRVLVTNRFSDEATLLDGARVVDRWPMDFYATAAVFVGEEAWVANRWRDAVQVIDGRVVAEIPVPPNPSDLALSADGATVAVASQTALTVSLLDVGTRAERARVRLGAPANGLAYVGDWLVVATLSASTHHPATWGPDGDGDGQPGDGTPNVNFQDLQSELAVIAPDGTIAHRYTSDTICCRDWRDVDPRDAARGGDLLPPAETWIVGGAVPEQVAADGNRVFVTYSGSNELQRFELDPETGALSPGPTWPTGHAPHGVAVADGRVLVAERLGETLGVYDAETGERREIVVGDVSGGVFPATDAEIGELVNSVTGAFTVDGDTSCAACHRERGNVDKALSMPLTKRPGVGLRMTMAYRGAADTRPWFFESAMDETNFLPVLNEFARVENFCCTDWTLFPDGAPADCAEHPPPECALDGPYSTDGFGAVREGPYTHPRPTAFPTRDAFFLDAAARVIGRTESFGDALYREDPLTGDRRPLKLDFDGLTRALGVFLLHEPGLLPNPNGEDSAVRRGRAIFESAEAGCSACHPAPTFAASTDHNPFGVPLRMGPVVTPLRAADGTNLDLLSDGFLSLFPRAEQESCAEVCGELCDAEPAACDDARNVRFGVPTLRGIWDRAPSMLHDGRANGLREVLATPGHPVLRAGETGFNERDGVPDTHGGTSHLGAQEVEDLIRYLETL